MSPRNLPHPWIARCNVVTAIFPLLILVAWAGSVGASARQHLRHDDEWYRGDAGRWVAENILSHQSDLGGWPKNVDTTIAYRGADRAKDLRPTFDNGATTDELRFLARAHRAAPDEKYKRAFLKGYDHVL